MEEILAGPSGFDVGCINRARWNVVDILEWISRPAVTAQLICDIDTARSEKLLKQLSQGGEKITITALLLKAISVAQVNYPDSRSYKLPLGPKITREEPVAGFTVEREIDGKPAVFFASIRNAHKKSLAEIAREISAYGRNDVMSVTQLTKEHLLSFVPWILRQVYIAIGLNIPFLREIINPATFGLTSLGKFGIDAPLAPNVTTTIFGIGTIAPKPVVRAGQIEIANIMQVAMSIDLRVFGMYEAAYMLEEVKTLVEGGMAQHLTDSEREQLSRVLESERLAAEAENQPLALPLNPDRFGKTGRKQIGDAA